MGSAQESNLESEKAVWKQKLVMTGGDNHGRNHIALG